MKQSTKSFGEKRGLNSSTPMSTSSINTRRHQSKQQKSIEDIYLQVRSKINQMQSAFKSENTMRQRQMLKTYIKILNKIGQEVIESKEKYLNLDKENLKTDKRLEIVTQLNRERSQCQDLVKSIKSVKQEIKKYEDENNYLEKQVQALQSVAKRKRSLSKDQRQKYRATKSQFKSIEKRLIDDEAHQKMKQFSSKKSADLTQIKNRAKSFIVNNFDPQGDQSNRNMKKVQRPKTQQKYIGTKRNNKILNIPLKQNCQF